MTEPLVNAADQADRWCLRLAGDPLSSDEADALKVWLDQTPEHQRRLNKAMDAWRSVGEQAVCPEMMALREDALRDARQAGKQRLTERDGLSAVVRIGLAASLVLVIGSGAAWMTMRPDIYQTGAGERRTIRLDDGSMITLDSASRLKIRYTQDRRRLWLEDGRATFQVAKQALRPFSVASGNSVVVATGTRFSVEKLSNTLRVGLYEGTVSVLDSAQTANEADPKGLSLKPGQGLVTDLDQASPSIMPIDSARDQAWEMGQLIFMDEPLGSAVERVNRYTQTPIRIDDPSALSIRISGVFKAGDTFAFVEGVTAVFPVRSRTEERTIVLERRSS